MNDLPESLHCGIKIFADDSKLYRPICSLSDSASLQEDLNAALHWADRWQLSFNPGKCKVLHIGGGNQHHTYRMGGTTVAESEVEGDLGVHMDTQLKFRKQAVAAVRKATQVIAVICWSFHLLDKSTLPLLLKALIPPHLEYGNLVWGPFNWADQRLVERVQRRATKLVPDLRQSEAGSGHSKEEA